MEIKELELHANRIRKNILTEVHSANSGHPGGSLSGADILTEIYFERWISIKIMLIQLIVIVLC